MSANSDFTKPGDVFRRVMECVASGLFLPTGPGLSDPCEKGRVDASAGLTAQDRANITLSAQVRQDFIMLMVVASCSKACVQVKHSFHCCNVAVIVSFVSVNV